MNNNKGFTLIELLAIVILIGLVITLFISLASNTRSISNEESYKLMLNNILVNAKTYILECDNNMIDCSGDYNWIEETEEKNTSFTADKLLKYGYFDQTNFIRPSDNKDIGSCLIINVKKDKYQVLTLSIDDSSC